MRDVQARLRDWSARLGMDSWIDAAGNLHALRHASMVDAPTLFVGSHLDTVPNAGAFDGILGVVMGLALMEMIGSSPLPFAIRVVGFSEEEGVRFAVPFIGSRALIGTLDDALLARADSSGVTVRQAISAFGLNPSALADAAIREDAVGYLELHIEQGPVLDRLGIPLGIVDAIVGQTRGDMRFTGRAGHAGTTPMTARHDAVTAAAEWIVDVERRARLEPGRVATVGHVEASPGAGNVIAGVCACSLDVRHADDQQRLAFVDELIASAQSIALARQTSVVWKPKLDQPAVTMDPVLVDTLERAAAASGTAAHRLASGAGHDAMIMAARMPAAMLFLRSPGGISHHPDEAVLVDDVAAALRAGHTFIQLMAARHV